MDHPATRRGFETLQTPHSPSRPRRRRCLLNGPPTEPTAQQNPAKRASAQDISHKNNATPLARRVCNSWQLLGQCPTSGGAASCSRQHSHTQPAHERESEEQSCDPDESSTQHRQNTIADPAPPRQRHVNVHKHKQSWRDNPAFVRRGHPTGRYMPLSYDR